MMTIKDTRKLQISGENNNRAMTRVSERQKVLFPYWFQLSDSKLQVRARKYAPVRMKLQISAMRASHLQKKMVEIHLYNYKFRSRNKAANTWIVIAGQIHFHGWRNFMELLVYLSRVHNEHYCYWRLISGVFSCMGSKVVFSFQTITTRLPFISVYMQIVIKKEK